MQQAIAGGFNFITPPQPSMSQMYRPPTMMNLVANPAHPGTSMITYTNPSPVPPTGGTGTGTGGGTGTGVPPPTTTPPPVTTPPPITGGTGGVGGGLGSGIGMLAGLLGGGLPQSGGSQLFGGGGSNGVSTLSGFNPLQGTTTGQGIADWLASLFGGGSSSGGGFTPQSVNVTPQVTPPPGTFGGNQTGDLGGGLMSSPSFNNFSSGSGSSGDVGQVQGQTEPGGTNWQNIAQQVAALGMGQLIPGGGMLTNAAFAAYPGLMQSLNGQQNFTQSGSQHGGIL